MLPSREDILRPWTLGGAAVASSGAIGAASTASPLPALGLSGLAGFAWLATAPLYVALGGFLAVRAVSDEFAARPLVAGLNSGALLGLAAISLAAVRVGTIKRPRGIVMTLLILGAIAFSAMVGSFVIGYRQGLLEEYIRSASVVAVGLMAANPRGRPSPSKAATALIIAAIVPALSVTIEGLTQWQRVLTEGFRPQGTLSHPNAAANLFNIMLAVSFWKWMYDGKQTRYLFAAGLMMTTVLMTQSMGGFFQLVATVTALGLFQFRGVGVRLLAVVAIAGLLAFFVFDPIGLSRADELSSNDLAAISNDDAQNSLDWRLLNWSRLVEEWRKEPVFGWGLSATSDYVRPLAGPRQDGQPHSDVVRLLVEGGVAGFVLVAGVWVVLVLWLFRQSRANRPNASFMAATMAILLGVTAHGTATDATLNTGPMYFVAALIGTALAVGTAGSSTEDPAPPR